jgi:hypothetical protein
MVMQVMLVVGGHQRIYCEQVSLMLENEVGLEESAAGGIQRHCLRVLVARIVHCPVPGLT